MFHKKVKSDRVGKHFECVPILNFSFVDKSRLLPKTVLGGIHCYSTQDNYIIITSTKTEKKLTRKIQLFSLRYLGFTAFCTLKSNLHLFLRCGFHARVLLLDDRHFTTKAHQGL